MKLKGKDFILGFQHLFAMFGATVLVPVLTGLSVSATLLFAGIGTLLFHILTGRKVPVFLGSSFAFLGGYFAIAELCQNSGIDNFSAYAGVGVACAGLVYVAISILFKVFGAGRVMKFFPPVVTGPIIIAIGLTLSSSAISNCSSNWIIALVAIAVVIICNIWGKGMVKIIPILLGVIASYVVGICMGQVDFTAVKEAAWIGLPVASINETAFSLFKNCNTSVLITSILTIMPISLATIIEHIGDVSAVSSTVGENFIAKPGLHRTLLGDGLATTLAALFGAPANTTYGENTGVLALTKVYDPKVIRLAAIFAVILSFSPKFAAIVSAMPAATMGGISLVLYGMISAVGVRNVVENQVDFSKSRNIIIAALILVLAIGVKFGTGDAEAVVFQISQVTISLSGIAVAAIIGILLNAVLPGKDYVFKEDENKGTNTGVSFKV
jgi:uracil permease